MKDHKHATNPKTIQAHLILAQLRQEALAERRAQDDDCLPAPDPLASAQSRRAAVLQVAR